MTRLEKLNAMLADSPEDEFLNYALGMELVAAGRNAEALNAFRRVQEISPTGSAAFFQEAQLLARSGRVIEAKDAAAKGVAAARVSGDQHAAEEIAGFLQSLA
jgi:Flp pilus assembly protein TadD